MPRNNEIPSYESILEFQEVYIRAVALSWVDLAFKDAFLRDPETALELYFGYRLPWTVTLETFDPGPSFGWDKAKQTWNLPESEISFGIPAKPAGFDEQIIAFAAYNDAGPTYLFTCC